MHYSHFYPPILFSVWQHFNGIKKSHWLVKKDVLSTNDYVNQYGSMYSLSVGQVKSRSNIASRSRLPWHTKNCRSNLQNENRECPYHVTLYQEARKCLCKCLDILLTVSSPIQLTCCLVSGPHSLPSINGGISESAWAALALMEICEGTTRSMQHVCLGNAVLSLTSYMSTCQRQTYR